MKYASCPTGIVTAPVDVVCTLLTRPEEWGVFYDVRITAVDPAGTAIVGQTIFAESGPRLLHLRLRFRFSEVDATHHKLGLDVQMPFGLTVREDLTCAPVGLTQCRVSYHCGFGFPAGWRGAVMYFFLRRGLDSGPADSLTRLQREAERLYAISPTTLSARE